MSDQQGYHNNISGEDQSIHRQQYSNNQIQQSHQEQLQNQHNEFSNNNDSQKIQQDSNFFQIYGMFFCGVCKNMINPLKSNGDSLQFRCKKCPPRTINFKHRQNNKCMLYSKALQRGGSRRTIVDPKFIFDPTMPKLSIACPDCDYPEAVYLITPDQGQRKIVTKLICMRGADNDTIQCGAIWDLEEDVLMNKDSIKMQISKRNIQEEDND